MMSTDSNSKRRLTRRLGASVPSMPSRRRLKRTLHARSLASPASSVLDQCAYVQAPLLLLINRLGDPQGP